MKAIVMRAPGGPEVLELREVPDPVPAEREVVIDVRATALNRADLLQRRGKYAAPPGASGVLGLECAGVVSGVGAGVASVRVGDRVMALLGGGGYAERVAVHEQLTLPIPDALDFERAAAVPEAFLTASEALFGLAKTMPGEWVLIDAAGSGVGSAAVQLARCAGARVLASTSAGKRERVAKLGAERVVARETEDFAAVALEVTGGRGVDVILDLVGGSYLAKHQECLGVLGRHVVLGLLGGAKAELDLSRVLSRRQSLLGLIMRTRPLADRIRVVERFRRQGWDRLARGELVPIVDVTFPLAEAARAHAHLETNANFGKVVLSVTAVD
jgi:putative PIG3 family NAD(P)H quinone oxidoreductase